MKKSNSKKKNKSKKEKLSLHSDMLGIIYITSGLILSAGIYTNLAGVLSFISRKYLYNFIGVGSFIIPIYIIYIGVKLIKDDGKLEYGQRFLGLTLIAIISILFISTIKLQTIRSLSTFSETLKVILLEESFMPHGGFVGHAIAYPIYKLLGFVGAYILYLSVICIGVLHLSHIKLYTALQYIITTFKMWINNCKKDVIHKNTANSPKNNINSSFVELAFKDDIVNSTSSNAIDDEIKIFDFMKKASFPEEIDNADENINAMECGLSMNPEQILSDVNSPHTTEVSTITELVEYNYTYPTIELLKNNSKAKLKSEDKKDLIESANKLEAILASFGVEAKVTQVAKGPSVTRFELQPSPGVKVSKIVNLQDDIALGLAANGIRIEAPIPGKSAIGIEVPNKKQIAVFLREVLSSKEFNNSDKKLAFGLGKDIAGKCVIGDLSKMPHMLIAGATGSGKSVCINALIVSLIYKYSPSDVKLLMVDPKVVELSVYNDIPHLLIPVVTDPKKAAGALNWAVNEMNKRYNLFSNMKVKNIESYNNLYEKGGISEKLPYIVIIVDELADLMLACPNDVEDYICRLAQMARAAGMHLIIATQRPSVDVITGVIKANIPSRISFAVSSGIDSRTILDQIGAEKLLGRGDMLYYPIGENKPLRVQGAFISEEEVEKVVDFVKDTQEVVNYKDEILNHINNETTENAPSEYVDELIEEAIKIVIEHQQASTSFLQRKLRVGFNRASRIMDILEEERIISKKDGSKPRQVLISHNQQRLSDTL